MPSGVHRFSTAAAGRMSRYRPPSRRPPVPGPSWRNPRDDGLLLEPRPSYEDTRRADDWRPSSYNYNSAPSRPQAPPGDDWRDDVRTSYSEPAYRHSPTYPGMGPDNRYPWHETYAPSPSSSHWDSGRNWQSSSASTYMPSQPAPDRYLPPQQRDFSSQPSGSRQPPQPPTLPPPLPGAHPFDKHRPHVSSAREQTPEYRPYTWSTRHRSPTPPPFVPDLPKQSYLDLSAQRPSTSSTIVPKVLVLDLNGALVYRASSNRRKAHPRPYLANFLSYLFTPEPEHTDAGSRASGDPVRPWEVFVWSSAQPHNVRAMVEETFGSTWTEGIWQHEDEDAVRERRRRGEGRLMGVWARDKMGLSSADYRRKVQTFKDLRKVIDHLAPNGQLSPELVGTSFPLDERNIVLLDDSPLKAVFQPWSQIVIPEYDKSEYASSRVAALNLSVGGDGEGMDETLLGVIGILEELRKADNVPAFVRRNGLLLQTAEAEVLEAVVDDLPSHPSFTHWYQEPDVLQVWTQKGREALVRKGISIEHGIAPEGASRAGSATPGPDWAAPRAPRAWSPSGPAERALEEVAEHDAHRNGDPSSTAGPSVSTTASDVDRDNGGSSSERWRTFNPAEVAIYLRNLADHPFLQQNARTRLLDASDTLLDIGSPSNALQAPNGNRANPATDYDIPNQYIDYDDGATNIREATRTDAVEDRKRHRKELGKLIKEFRRLEVECEWDLKRIPKNKKKRAAANTRSQRLARLRKYFTGEGAQYLKFVGEWGDKPLPQIRIPSLSQTELDDLPFSHAKEDVEVQVARTRAQAKIAAAAERRQRPGAKKKLGKKQKK